MSKISIVLASAVVLVGVGCAHNQKNAAAARERASAIRLDPSIRTACGDTEVDAFFSYDSAELSPGAQARLDALANCLNTGSLAGKNINITGYTDPSGTEKYNNFLGKERADSVAEYLTGKGVDRSRINTASRGEAGASANPDNWAWDRMVDVSLN